MVVKVQNYLHNFHDKLCNYKKTIFDMLTKTGHAMLYAKSTIYNKK